MTWSMLRVRRELNREQQRVDDMSRVLGAQEAAGRVIGSPVPRTVALGSAYQASDASKPAFVSLNLASTSSNSLLSSAQAVQAGEVIVGSSAGAVTAATGHKVATHRNAQGGTLVVGLTITQEQHQNVALLLPAGWYFGVRQTTGANLSVPSAFDQTVG